MKTTEFLPYLAEQVKKSKGLYSLREGAAFGLWYAVNSLELADDDAYEAVAFDGANDKGIDLFFIDQQSERIVIGQLKYNAKGQYKAKKTELLGLLHTTDWLKDPPALEREGRKDLAAAAHEYIDAISQGYSVEYVYAFCGPANKDVSDAARQFNVSEAGTVPSQMCRIVDLSSLMAEHVERIDQATRIPRATLKVHPTESFEEKGAFGKALVTTISGSELKRLYTQHGDSMFNRNVRLFLGARKGGVNAGIRDTIDSVQDRRNFWAYNNGVTVICDRYTQRGNELTLTNFSIVNGCQTTVTIGNSLPTAAKQVRVLVRFISAPENAIDSIIRFTNSQNPIRLWDLTAQDKLQKRLKKELASLPQPFFYVLRKGETRQLSTADKNRYRRNGKGPLLSIPLDLNAQYLAAFHGLPAVAYKDKGRVFSAHYHEVFPSQVRAEEVVLAWQAGSVAAAAVKDDLERAIADEDESRVAVLKRGAKFFVLAAMATVLHERNGKTFLNRLSSDVAVSKTTEERLRNYAVIALEWYVEAALDLTEAGTEITTIVRSQEQWAKIRRRLESRWRVYSRSKRVVEDALPLLR